MAEKEHAMTHEELAAIKARAEAASDGPWEAIPDPAYGDDGYLLAVGPVWALGGGTLDLNVGDDDAAFICAAREDIPRLVTEVERLQCALAQRSTQEALGDGAA
jgi:hypothetical protein